MEGKEAVEREEVERVEDVGQEGPGKEPARKTGKGRGKKRSYTPQAEKALKTLAIHRSMAERQLRRLVKEFELGDPKAVNVAMQAMIRSRMYPIMLRLPYAGPMGGQGRWFDLVDVGAPILRFLVLLLEELAKLESAVAVAKHFGLATSSTLAEAREFEQNVTGEVVAMLSRYRKEAAALARDLLLGHRREKFDGTLAEIEAAEKASKAVEVSEEEALEETTVQTAPGSDGGSEAEEEPASGESGVGEGQGEAGPEQAAASEESLAGLL